jgi:hypothetical protein
MAAPRTGSDAGFERGIAVLYTFEFVGIDIKQIRSAHSDTDYATFALTVTDAAGAPNGQNPQTIGLGDVGKGTHPVNLKFADVDVPDGGSVALIATVMNKGAGNAAEIVKDLNQVGQTVAGAVAGGAIAGMAATLRSP